jgi:hypothetical protein
MSRDVSDLAGQLDAADPQSRWPVRPRGENRQGKQLSTFFCNTVHILTSRYVNDAVGVLCHEYHCTAYCFANPYEFW